MDIDIWRVIEFVLIAIFGLVTYVERINSWTQSIPITVIFTVLLFVIVFMVVGAYLLITERNKKEKDGSKSKTRGREQNVKRHT